MVKQVTPVVVSVDGKNGFGFLGAEGGSEFLFFINFFVSVLGVMVWGLCFMLLQCYFMCLGSYERERECELIWVWL